MNQEEIEISPCPSIDLGRRGEFSFFDSLNFDSDFDDPELGEAMASPSRSGRRQDEIGLLGQPSPHLTGIIEESRKSNLRMAFMNMANSIIGAGVIGQAYAVKQAGLIGGIFLLVTLTIVIGWTIRLMVTNSKLSGMRTYQSTVKYCFGRTGEVVISFAQGAFAFGGSMAYCVIIGDTVPHVLRAIFSNLAETSEFFHVVTSRNFVVVICVGLICFPLALNRNIAALAKVSALALISMVVITLTVAIRGPAVSPPSAHMSLPLWTVNKGFFQAVSVISFAFVCHHNTLLIYDSLKTPTLTRFAQVVHWSTGVSMIACAVLGLGGFLSFKNQTLGNILNNFLPRDVMANVARFCFGFNMVTTLPLEIFVCREVVLEFFYPHLEQSTPLEHILTTTGLIFTAMGISLLTCDLGVILELVGATSACSMAYILPPMCFLHLSSKRNSHPQKILCWACIFFGASVMVLSTIMTVLNMGQGEHKKCIA